MDIMTRMKRMTPAIFALVITFSFLFSSVAVFRLSDEPKLARQADVTSSIGSSLYQWGVDVLGGTAVSGRNVIVGGYQDRYILAKFDLSSIPTGSTITDVNVSIYMIETASYYNRATTINATAAFGGAAGLVARDWRYNLGSTVSPPGSKAFNLGVAGQNTNGYHSANGMSSTWQTEFNTNRTIYIGFSAWEYRTPSDSGDDISLVYSTTTGQFPKVIITYTPPPTWAPTFVYSVPTDPTSTVFGDFYNVNFVYNETLDSSFTLTTNATLTGAVLTVPDNIIQIYETSALSIGWYYVDIFAISAAGTLGVWHNYTLYVVAVPPVFTSSPVTSASTGDTYYYDANTDISSTFSMTQQAVGGTLSIVAGTGIVTGTMSTTYAGNKWVDITATSLSGGIAHQNYTITITDDINPVANAGSDQTVPTLVDTLFSGSGSSDNIGVTNYTWTFYADSQYVTLYDVGPSYAFLNIGTITVTLTVKDAAGNQGQDTMVVTAQRANKLRPNGLDGSSTWGGSTPQYRLIDDVQAGGDQSDYIFAGSGVGATAKFTLTDFIPVNYVFNPPRQTYWWVQFWVIAEQTTSTPSATITLSVMNGTTTYYTQTFTLSTIWANYSISTTMRSTGVPWTATDLDNLELYIASSTAATTKRVSQMGAVVWEGVTLPVANVYRDQSVHLNIAHGLTPRSVTISISSRGTWHGTGGPPVTNINYTWTVRDGNGTILSTHYGAGVSVNSFSQTFLAAGTYIVTLNMTVTMAWGVQQYSNDTATIVVLPPVASALWFSWLSASGVLTIMAGIGFLGGIATPVLWYRKREEEGPQGFVWMLGLTVMFWGIFYACITVFAP